MNRTLSLAPAIGLLLTSCNAPTYSADILDDGDWRASFSGATLTTSIGEDGTPTTESVDLIFNASVADAAFTLGETGALCYADSEEALTTTTTYPLMCNYDGPGVLLSYDADQLFPGQPASTLIGPSAALEAWGQSTYTSVEERTVYVEQPYSTPPEDAYPTPASPEEIQATCTTKIYTWAYGQLTSRTEMHLILRVTEFVTCDDPDGLAIPSEDRTRYLEAEGTLSRTLG